MKVPFGSYWIDRKVAVGGMAEIYHAMDAHDHEVAIKKIHPDLASQEKFIQMFLDEVRIVIQLNHPHIVQLLDFGLAEGSYFFSMEWIDGKSLSEIVGAQKRSKTPFPVDVALWMVRDVCRGLFYAHQKKDRFDKPMNLVHRDISPPNIMTTREGVFKVADFGIAHVRDKNVKTQPGIIRGKFSYMSPEQSLGKPLDHRSDIFSVGVVLYEVLADTRLFLRKNEIETLEAVRKCEVTPIKQRRSDVSYAVEDMVKKSLAPTAQGRFNNALEFSKAAEKILKEEYPESTRANIVEFFRNIYTNETFKDLSRSTKVKNPPIEPTPSPIRVRKVSRPQEKFDWMVFMLEHRYMVTAVLGMVCIFIAEFLT